MWGYAQEIRKTTAVISVPHVPTSKKTLSPDADGLVLCSENTVLGKRYIYRANGLAF